MNRINKLFLFFGLLWACFTNSFAQEKLFFPSFNIEPGQRKQVPINLVNSQIVKGFQFDLILPDGISISNLSESVSKTERMDETFSILTNSTESGTLKLVCFSFQEHQISIGSGSIVKLVLDADSTFSGGDVMLKNIVLIDSSNCDIELTEQYLHVGSNEINTLSIDDFSMCSFQEKPVSVILSNETPITAFQFDMELPSALTIDKTSFKLSERCSSHSLSYKIDATGIIRIVCFSETSQLIASGNGPIIEFDVSTSLVNNETARIEIRSIKCTKDNAQEISIPDTTTVVSLTKDVYIPAKSIEINKHTLILEKTKSEQLTFSLLPTNSSVQIVTWSCSDSTIAKVSPDGLVKTYKEGEAWIFAHTIDGTNLSDSCHLSVIGKYLLTYCVDGKTVSSDSVLYGTTLIAKEGPTKKGYIFCGWDGLPVVMPAHDVTVTGIYYAIGDANGDGEINVSDFTAIASRIMGNPPASFVEKAADVNQDGEINVGDLTAVANIILHGSQKAPVQESQVAGNFQTPTNSADNCLVTDDEGFTVNVRICISQTFYSC